MLGGDEVTSSVRTVPAPPKGPGFAYATLDTTDPQQHSTAISECNHVYEQVERGPFRGRISELQLDSIHILRDQLFNPHGYVGPAWADSHVFFSFLPSAGAPHCHGRQLGHNTVMKYPRGHFYKAYSSGPVDCIAVSVRADAIEAESVELTGREISPHLLSKMLCVAHTELVARFQRCVENTLLQAALPGHLADAEWRGGARQNLMQLLLEVVEFGNSSAHKLPAPSTRAYIVDKTVEYMKANIMNLRLMSDICKTMRVPPRTLRYSFETVLGVSPAHYLLSLRLQHVRQELLDGRGSSGIHRVAERYGFGNMGRFALFYQQAFGELPSETCRNATAGFRATARNTLRRQTCF